MFLHQSISYVQHFEIHNHSSSFYRTATEYLSKLGSSEDTANAEAIAILQLLHEQDKHQLKADNKQKDDTIEDLNLRQRYIEQDLDQRKGLVEKRENQIRELCKDIQKVFLNSIFHKLLVHQCLTPKSKHFLYNL